MSQALCDARERRFFIFLVFFLRRFYLRGLRELREPCFRPRDPSLASRNKMLDISRAHPSRLRRDDRSITPHSDIDASRARIRAYRIFQIHIFSGAGMPSIHKPFLSVRRTASTIATLCGVSAVPSRICTCAYQLLNALAISSR